MLNLQEKLQIKQKLEKMHGKLGVQPAEISLHEIPILRNDFNTVIAIDGSFLPIYKVDIYDLVLFRIASVKITGESVLYDSEESACVIGEGVIVDDDAIIREAFKISKRSKDQVSNIMEMKERSYLRRLAETNSTRTLFLIDGSFEPLMFSPVYKAKSKFLINQVSALFDSNHAFVAISKKSQLSTIDAPHLDEYVLSSKGNGYVFVNIEDDSMEKPCTDSPDLSCEHCPHHGKPHPVHAHGISTAFVKFPHGKQFYRVDVINIEMATALSSIANYCKGAIPGYPTPLTEAHRYAKFIRDMQNIYKCAAIDALAQAGIEGGAFCNNEGMETSFHDDLDKTTKWE